MVAYSFKREFIRPIETRTKRQTLRNDRRRHARVTEDLQLYTGMRTKQCRLIGRAFCIAVAPIRLDFKNEYVYLPASDEMFSGAAQLNAFAELDGFAEWCDLVEFWRDEHPTVKDAWEGVRIFWGSTFRAPV